jgi:transmembrane 9 superfamily member 2/4
VTQISCSFVSQSSAEAGSRAADRWSAPTSARLIQTARGMVASLRLLSCRLHHLMTMNGRCRFLIFTAIAYVLRAPPAHASSILPGISPVDYARGAELDIFALNLVSQTIKLPFDYFSLPFCKPDKRNVERVRSARTDQLALGQILMGERARLTAFHLRMLENETCAQLCTQDFSSSDIALLAKRIVENFRVRLILDEMPVSVVINQSRRRPLGYPLGVPVSNMSISADRLPKGTESDLDSDERMIAKEEELTGNVSAVGRSTRMDVANNTAGILHSARIGFAVYNHLDLTILYHVPDDLEALTGSKGLMGPSEFVRIVGFEVVPRSVEYPLANPPPDVADADHCVSSTGTPNQGQNYLLIAPMLKGGSHTWTGRRIKFTYSVKYVESSIKWATRFDSFFDVSGGRYKIQLFSIVNSLMLALLLTAVFGAVLLRTLRRDCTRYGIAPSRATDLIMDDFHDDFENDSGWRMLRGDVFRPPPGAGLLSILCGSGMQIAGIVLASLLCSLFGVISPNRHGNLVSAVIGMWALSSSVAGYVAASIYKAIGGSRWKLVTLGVAVGLPGMVFGTFMVFNFFMWAMGSIGAAPVLTLLALFAIWLGVSVPLAFAGTYFGFSRKVYDFPVRTNQIPRQIPPQPYYLKSPQSQLVAGLLPFGIVAIELRIVLSSIWHHEYYRMFACLFTVYILLAVTCAEVSVVLSYIRLANEDWAWWWPSFWAAGSSGLYIFLYSLYTLVTSPGADPSHIVSNTLFVAYSALIAFGFALLTGSIGCLSSLAFVRRIYSASSDD